MVGRLNLLWYGKGDVDQIIHSRKSCFVESFGKVYIFLPVNEYCSGYGKVAAVENLDPDFLMCVSQEPLYPLLE